VATPLSSRKLIVFGLVLAVIVAIPAFFLARRKNPPTDRVTRIALGIMRSDLEGLMRAEVTTRQIRGRFVADAADAGQLSSPGVSPPVIVLVDTGFTAVVTYKTIPGIRCAVGVYARNPIDRFAKSGEIVCE
jgi:hypothetical protein